MRTAIALVVALFATSSQAVVFDLGADWSTASNPNGVWSYRNASGLLGAGTWTGDPFTTPQAAWNGPFPQTIFKYNGTGPALDWQTGDVINHNGGSALVIVRFTSPFAGTISATGSTWEVRNIGRHVHWEFRKNGSLISGADMNSGTTTRATPMNFFAGTGGAAALTNISVVAGDTLDLMYNAVPGSAAEYAGINLQVNAVPEPATFLVFSLGALAALRRRRDKGGLVR